VIPKAGPALYLHSSVSYVSIAGGTSLQRKPFRWPRDVFCTGIWFGAQSGSPFDNANLTLQLEDATFQNLFSDGQGGTFALPSLALIGGPTPGAGAPQAGFRWFPMQAPIAKGDIWLATVANTKVEEATVPILIYAFDEAYPDKLDELLGASL
jgi:hypothetical protein